LTKAHRADWSKSAKSYVENLIRALGAANVAVLGISGRMGRADLGPTGLSAIAAAALSSLQTAAKQAPREYADYLTEAVECYERQLYRAAILMVWAATVEHMFGVAGSHRGGIRSTLVRVGGRVIGRRSHAPHISGD
jgi:hypothetical protein